MMAPKDDTTAQNGEGEWEYGRQYSEMDGSPYIRPASEYQGDTTSPDGHRADGSPYWNYTRVRRRKAGKWAPEDTPEEGHGMSTEAYWEYGYRITSGPGEGREVWQVDHGTDGVWTPWQPDLNIDHVDTDSTDAPARICGALAKANVAGVVLRREVTVTTGPAEEVKHAG